jgi:(p)ppGpp synthase/HD superfamily hydrolase
MRQVNESVAAAVRYAEQLHAGQLRKGTQIPYFEHLVGTMEHVARHGGSDVELMAAVLHDAIEDQARDGTTASEIGQLFGAEVLAVVKGCTNVFDSKMAYAAHLAEVPASVALVAACDKLYNARSIVEAHAEVGPSVFSRFKGSKADVLAYYRAVAESLKPKVPTALAAELEAVVSNMESL